VDGNAYFIPTAVLAASLAVRVTTVVRHRRNPYVQYGASLIGLGAVTFALAAPPTIHEVNAAIGVPNISAPIVYACNALFSYAGLALILYWRGGDLETVRRQAKRWKVFYLSLACVIFGLFSLGEAPDERLVDFDTYYATTPGMREMIVAYLTGHLIASTTITWLCWRWATRVTGRWLRASLIILVLGFLFSTGFGVAKVVAVIARWCGGDLDLLSSDLAPPLGSVGAQLAAVGFLIPLIGPRLTAWLRARAQYRRLEVLWKAMSAVADTADQSPLPRRAGLELRLVERETQIADGLLKLEPRLDLDRQQVAYDSAIADGHGPGDAARIAAAAMIFQALDAPHDLRCPRPDGPLDLRTVLGSGAEDLAAVGESFARLHRERRTAPLASQPPRALRTPASGGRPPRR
jgi:hypothetical protein